MNTFFFACAALFIIGIILYYVKFPASRKKFNSKKVGKTLLILGFVGIIGFYLVGALLAFIFANALS